MNTFIPKSKRFKEEKKTHYNTSVDLNPKFNFKEKKVQGFNLKKSNLVKNEIRKELKKRKIKKLRQSGTSQKLMDNLSIATADTEIQTVPGPGAYNPLKFDDFLADKKVTIPKSKRFKAKKKDKKKGLQVKYSQVE